MPQYNDYPEITSLTDNDIFLTLDAETNATSRIKASAIKNYAGVVGNSGNNLQIAPAMTAQYRFNQGTGQQLTDFSDNNLNGAIANTALWSNWSSSGLNFLPNQHIALPARNWFSGNFYIESVVLLRNYTNWARIVDCSTAPASSDGAVYLATSFQSTGRAVLGILEGSQITYIQTNFPLPLNSVFHLAAQFNNGVGTIFFNGLPVASGNLPTPRNVSRPIAYIGRSSFPDDFFDGWMFRLNIYDRALTNQERINNFIFIKQDLESHGVFLL